MCANIKINDQVKKMLILKPTTAVWSADGRRSYDTKNATLILLVRELQ